MLELEKTYLAKYIPEGLLQYPHKELIDIYLPEESTHPRLRIRKSGDKYEMTKMTKIGEDDASQQIEQTIPLDEKEFASLESAEGKRLRKVRYYMPYQGRTAEVDVFQDDLSGLVVVDFEFNSPEEQATFEMPDFCLVDVTQETFIAGGMLCGKAYTDIEPELNRIGYKRLTT